MENLIKLQKIAVFIVIILFSIKISYAKNLATKKVIISTNLCIDWLILDSLNNNNKLLKNNIFILSPLIKKPENQGNYFQWKNIINQLNSHNGTLENIIQNIQSQPHIILTGEYDNPLLKKRLQRLNFNIFTLKLPQKISQIANYQAEFEKIIGIKNNNNNYQNLQKFNYKNSNKKTLLLLGASEIALANQTIENDILNYTKYWKNYLPENIKGYVAVNKEVLIKNPPDKIIFLQANFNNKHNSLATNFFHENFYKNFSSKQNSNINNWRWQCPGKWSFDLIEMLDKLDNLDKL